MGQESANLSVVVVAQQVDTHHTVPWMDVLLNQGVASQQAQLNLYTLEQQTGRTRPALPFCPGSFAETLRFYRNQLGATLTAAHNALAVAQAPLNDTVEQMDRATESVDRILALNPDPTTPNNTTDLIDEIGGLNPTTDRNALEQRLSDTLDLNIVDGVLFPKGPTRLTAVRELAAATNVTEQNPDFDRMGGAVGGTGETFTLVSTETITVERVVGSTCGEPIVEYVAEDRYLSTNAKIPEGANINLFWLDGVKADSATQKRMRALGMTTEEIAAALVNDTAGRLTTATVVDTSILPQLRAQLTDAQTAKLLRRADTTSGANLDPSDGDIIKAIQDAINANTGGNRNRAGTTKKAIDSGRAGRGGDPVLMLLALIDFPRSFRQFPRQASDFDEYRGAFADSEECIQLVNLISVSMDSLISLLAEAQAFVQELLGRLGLGLHKLDAGIGFASCLASFNLGVDLALELAVGLPFQLQLFLATFATMLAAITSAVLALKGFLCIPQGLVQLLFGGICGFKPFDFEICPPPPDLGALLERLASMLGIITSLISRLVASMMTMRVDLTAALRASFDLKLFSACAVPVMPVGVALGLATVPGAAITASVAVTTPTEQTIGTAETT